MSSWRIPMARFVAGVTRPFEVLLRVSKIIQAAGPIGLLDSESIDRFVIESYNRSPDFYAPDHYRLRHEEEILPLLREHAGTDRQVKLLDLYCGHGREARIFAQAGFTVTGVDSMSSSITAATDYATRVGFDATFLTRDVNDWDPSETWDVVYTSLWMYSTIPDRSRRLEWLERLSRWVSEGGIIVVSVTPRQGGRGPLVRQRLAALIARVTRNPREPEIGDRFDRSLFWHDFSDDEAKLERDLAGLELLATHESTASPPCRFYLLRPSASQAK